MDFTVILLNAKIVLWAVPPAKWIVAAMLAHQDTSWLGLPASIQPALKLALTIIKPLLNAKLAQPLA